MPLYPYECKKCNHYLEDFASYDDPHLTLCPKCNTESLIRVFGVPVNPEVKTVGGIADRNAGKFSEAKKKELDEKHRTKNNQKDMLNKKGWKTRYGN